MTTVRHSDRLVRPRWARLKQCGVRDAWMLLVPERVLFPCPTTLEVLQRLDAPHTFGEIVSGLAREYDAPEAVISQELAPIVGDLVEKGYVRRLDA